MFLNHFGGTLKKTSVAGHGHRKPRFWSMWSVRSEPVSGTQRLRFMNKQDSRLCTLEQALLSVGYPVSGLLTDSYEVGTDISTLNTALFAARVYTAVWRA